MLKPKLDAALAYSYEDVAGTGGSEKVFARSNQSLIKMFLDDPADLDDIIAADGVYGDVSEQLYRVMRTKVGTALYKEAWRDVARIHLRKFVKDQINEIDYHDFNQEDIDVFNTLAGQKVDQMIALGHKHFEILDRDFTYLGEEIQGTVTCPNDEHTKPFDAFVRTCAVSCGTVRDLPYEQLLFPNGVLGCRSSGKVSRRISTMA